MKTYSFNNIDDLLKNSEEQRQYARDLCMLMIAHQIDHIMREQGVNRVTLADRIGRTKGFVSQVLSGSRNMTLVTLADLLSALGKEIRGLEVRSLGEMRVPEGVMNEWLDCEWGILKGTLDASAQAIHNKDLNEILDTRAAEVAFA